MAQPLGTTVNTDDLGNLGVQLGKAADDLGNALGDPARFTDIPSEAFGPAPNVVQNYHDLATQFVGHLNDAVTNLHNVGRLVQDGAQRYRAIDAANQNGIRSASPQPDAGQHEARPEPTRHR